MLIIYAILGLNFLIVLLLAFAWIQIYFMQKSLKHSFRHEEAIANPQQFSSFEPPPPYGGFLNTQPSVPKKNKPKVIDEFRAYQLEQEHIASRQPTQEFTPDKQYWG